jgi:MFS transporter, DHA1 family, tetracycline resistance protein
MGGVEKSHSQFVMGCCSFGPVADVNFKKPSLLIVFLSVFIDLIGFGIVIPLLPLYSKNFGASGLTIGLLVASYSAMQFLFAPLWGRLSDRIGRRPVILISNGGSAVSYVIFALASGMTGSTGLVLLFASRMFAGICGANIAVASAYIADVAPPEKRSAGMGLIGMAFGLGFIFGPALGAVSVFYLGITAPGWVAAGICASNLVLGYLVLRESLKPGSQPAPRRPAVSQWGRTLRQPTVGVLIAIFFLATFCFAGFESTFPLLLSDYHFPGLTTQELLLKAGFLFAYCGIISAIIQGGLIGRLVARFGEPRLIFFSLLMLGVSLALLPYQSGLGFLMLVLALLAAGSGIVRPPVFGLISLNTDEREQGATMGVAQSAGALARIAGPIFANVLYPFGAVIPYVLCGLLAVFAGLVAWQYLCRSRVQTLAAKLPVEAEQ